MFNKIITGLFLCLIPILGWAQKDVPEPTNFLVNDFAGMLSRQEVVQLGQKLRAYANETSTQIVVVTETTIAGENVFDYAHRLATTWGIGGGENDNGILLFVAQSERQISIQTGYGTEAFLPDAIAFDIIQNIIIPSFREGNFFQGIDRAIDRIMELGRGEYTNDGTQNRRQADGFGAGMWIFIFIFGFILLATIFGKGSNGDDDDDGGYYRGGRYGDRGRGYRRGRSGGGWIFLPGGGGFGRGGGGGGGGSDDGFGGFGGGGFGGFGGGDFGGGGAIGEW
ncbi:TPM domain-containing protein [Flavilitoribacter nigricans]|uniref:Methanol dehydrogenase n=1 Tax=Flavilitoribacter nigricans (strain ATCC 23147 / DSM 23189 / NBRC 102662 / NCIMB 1420 / SS-2) TaxID=1122177 RepID=A0A2D0N8J7_FLAN2|nr:TPM domain-containing protein [Flavilitoribacter nigricans]PHN04479.1 methanol dehydrogenase [Flavilitoribacter nigricans DSM 23189 = NBRC 102662]